MSSQTSGVTGGDLTAFDEQDEISSLELFEKEPMSFEWTDEKHSLYLKSMEASFVHQLYSSLDSSSLLSHKKHHSYMRSFKDTESHTRRQRIKFGRGEPPPPEADKCKHLLQNPWIQHFRTTGREDQIIQENSSFGYQSVICGGRKVYTCKPANTSENFPACQAHRNSGIAEEFSDQNFDEEDNDEGGTRCLYTAKRKNTVEAVAPSKCQVVPFRKSFCADLSEHCSSLNGRIKNDWQASKTGGSH